MSSSDLILKEWSVSDFERLHSLLDNSTLNDRERNICKLIISNEEPYSLTLLKRYLKKHQVDPILNGTYNMSQLKEFINEIK